MSETILPTNLSKNDNNNNRQSFSVAAFLVKFYNTTLHEENNFPQRSRVLDFPLVFKINDINSM